MNQVEIIRAAQDWSEVKKAALELMSPISVYIVPGEIKDFQQGNIPTYGIEKEPGQVHSVIEVLLDRDKVGIELDSGDYLYLNGYNGVPKVRIYTNEYGRDSLMRGEFSRGFTGGKNGERSDRIKQTHTEEFAVPITFIKDIHMFNGVYYHTECGEYELRIDPNGEKLEPYMGPKVSDSVREFVKQVTDLFPNAEPYYTAWVNGEYWEYVAAYAEIMLEREEAARKAEEQKKAQEEAEEKEHTQSILSELLNRGADHYVIVYTNDTWFSAYYDSTVKDNIVGSIKRTNVFHRVLAVNPNRVVDVWEDGTVEIKPFSA